MKNEKLIVGGMFFYIIAIALIVWGLAFPPKKVQAWGSQCSHGYEYQKVGCEKPVCREYINTGPSSRDMRCIDVTNRCVPVFGCVLVENNDSHNEEQGMEGEGGNGGDVGGMDDNPVDSDGSDTSGDGDGENGGSENNEEDQGPVQDQEEDGGSSGGVEEEVNENGGQPQPVSSGGGGSINPSNGSGIGVILIPDECYCTKNFGVRTTESGRVVTFGCNHWSDKAGIAIGYQTSNYYSVWMDYEYHYEADNDGTYFTVHLPDNLPGGEWYGRVHSHKAQSPECRWDIPGPVNVPRETNDPVGGVPDDEPEMTVIQSPATPDDPVVVSSPQFLVPPEIECAGLGWYVDHPDKLECYNEDDINRCRGRIYMKNHAESRCC